VSDRATRPRKPAAARASGLGKPRRGTVQSANVATTWFGGEGSMRIIAVRATAIALMLLVLGLARRLGQLGTPAVIEAGLVAAAAATAVLLFARR